MINATHIFMAAAFIRFPWVRWIAMVAMVQKLTATDTNIGNTGPLIGNISPHIGSTRQRSHIGDICPSHRKHTPSHRKPTPSYRQRTPLRLAFALVSMDSSVSTQSTSGHGIAHSLNTMDFHMSNGFLGFSWLPLNFFF